MRRQLKSGTAGGCGGCSGLTVSPTHRHVTTAAEPILHAIARRTDAGFVFTCSILQRTSSGIPRMRRPAISSGRVGAAPSVCRCSQRSDSISARRASRTGRRHAPCVEPRPRADGAGGDAERQGHAGATRLRRRDAAFAGARTWLARATESTLAGERIEPSARPVLVRRTLRVFPAALEQAHFLEPAERAVERPVGRQQPPVRDVREPLRDLVAIEIRCFRRPHSGSGQQDGRLEGDQTAGLSPHGWIISRYMLIGQIQHGPAMKTTGALIHAIGGK